MNLTTPALYLIIGSMGKGKSYLLEYMAYQLQHKLKYGLVFTNTKFTGKGFPYIAKEFIHDRYDEEKLIQLMTMQKRCVENGITNEAFVFFDDCLQPEQFSSIPFQELCFQLRHYLITVVISTQYCNKIPATIRSNFMGVFIFDSDSRRNLEAIYESFLGRFDSYIAFKDYIYDKLEGKYKFIYYDPTKTYSRKSKLEEIYEVMQCPPKIPEFYIEFPKEIKVPKQKKNKSKK